MPAENNAIDARASEWAVRLSARPLSGAEQAELDAWLAADTRHQGALARARAVWLDLDRLAALAGKDHGEPEHPLFPKTAPSSSRRWFLAAGLGAATVTAGAGSWWLWGSRETYVTEVGEIRRVTLTDGSSMLLNTATRAVVRFTSSVREIELTRGEGLFEVAKDAARAFIVRTRGVSVRAVGTVFAVRAVSENVDVTVTEGVVEVADTNRSGSAIPQRVLADQRALVTPRHGIKVQAVTEAQAQRRLAWRDGMLVFDGEPLSEAVDEVNRHNVRKITIDDPALAARPVVGIFRASDENGFARTVATALNAESTTDEDVIHLRARP
jgi:transmembrane sensor